VLAPHHVVSGCFPSPGQPAEEPSQISAASQLLAAPRHTKP